jgi:hypothetical protein
MSEKPAESGSDTLEQKAPPEPKVSADSTRPPSPAVTDQPDIARIVKEQLQAVLPELAETARRQAQASTDGVLVPYQQVIQKFNDLKRKHGGNEEAALSEMQLDARLEKLERGSSAVSDAGASGDVEYKAQYDKVLTETDTAPDDPDLIAIAERTWPSREAFVKRLPVELAKARSRKAKQSGESESSVVSEGGGNSPVQPGPNELVSKYAEEMYAARGNANAVRAIKDKYKQKGVPVDQVVLS